MGFISTLLYILLGFYIFKFILRLLAPKLMAYALKRLQKKMNGNFTDGFGYDDDVTNVQDFGNMPKQDSSEAQKAAHKKSSKIKGKQPVGEYIDFEEIE